MKFDPLPARAQSARADLPARGKCLESVAAAGLTLRLAAPSVPAMSPDALFWLELVARMAVTAGFLVVPLSIAFGLIS